MPVTPRSAPSSRVAVTVPLLAVALASGVVASVATVALTRAPAPQSPAAPQASASTERAVPATADTATADTATADIASAPSPAPDRPTAPDARIAELVAGLDAARAERSQLAATVVSLSREVGELTDAVGAMNLPRGGPPDPEAAPSLAEDSGAGASDAAPDDPLAGLVAAGLDPAAAAELRRRQDEYQLARLELVDQAAREGWEDSEEFEARLEALDDSAPELREELGDDGYDRYLYESGARNRVGIGSIIPGSAAATAGLRAGDLVLGYADERVFAPQDLQGATRAGARGESVTVLAERDGRTISVQVPRGPLGITLDRRRAEP